MPALKKYTLMFLMLSGCCAQNEVDSTIAELENLGLIIRRDSSESNRIDLIWGPELPLKDDDLKQIAKFPSIRRIELSNAEVSGSFLEFLKKPESLEVVRLSFCPITPDGVRRFRRLTNLRELSLMGPPYISNVEMESLASLKSLQVLELYGAHIDDMGLKKISGLTNLEALNISHTHVTADGISSLATLGKLKRLYLSGLRGTDHGLKGLAGNGTIEVLTLNNSDFSDLGVSSIRKLKSLRYLGIAGCAVTDAGLEELCKLPTLRELVIGGTKITDKSVSFLQDLKTIEMIDFGNDSLVTKEGIKQLRKYLPKTKIYYIPPTKLGP
jgi:internalin A